VLCGGAKYSITKVVAGPSYFKEIAMMIEIGSDPRVCPFCTLMLPNASALIRHYELSHGEWVSGIFESQLPGMMSEQSLKFVESEPELVTR
jgi:hypothetical protein